MIKREEELKILVQGLKIFNSICLNGKWGSGKTTFITKEIVPYFRDNEDFIVIVFNAWENDWENEPFNSLFRFIAKELNDTTKRYFKEFFGGIFNSLIENIPYFGNTLKNVKNSKFNTIMTSDYITTFKDELDKKLKDKEMILVIDELDRCKPIYALEIIEICKHLLNSKIKIIYSVDKEVLNQTIEHMYGLKNNENETYLYKVFDFNINLESFDFSELIEKEKVFENVSFEPWIIEIINKNKNLTTREKFDIVETINVLLKVFNNYCCFEQNLALDKRAFEQLIILMFFLIVFEKNFEPLKDEINIYKEKVNKEYSYGSEKNPWVFNLFSKGTYTKDKIFFDNGVVSQEEFKKLESLLKFTKIDNFSISHYESFTVNKLVEKIIQYIRIIRIDNEKN